MEYLFIVNVDLSAQSLDSCELDQWAFQDFSCEGRLDYDIDEEKVDSILGKDAYCGGEIPDEILEKIEAENADLKKVSYFWEEQAMAESFATFLGDKNISSQLDKKEKKDWNEAWRESFQSIIVSQDLKVVPSWEKSKDSKSDIFIYPGMGFGTGNHETTFLCLKIFEDILHELKEGVRCLDFGCGSGILGIAAIKKLKSTVSFVDIDVDALDNCVMNLEHNDFQNYSEGHGIVLRERFNVSEKYPLVFANILESVLISEKEVIQSCVDDEGLLIVSGLLKNQEQTILDQYSDYIHVKTEYKGDWIAILFRNAK